MIKCRASGAAASIMNYIIYCQPVSIAPNRQRGEYEDIYVFSSSDDSVAKSWSRLRRHCQILALCRHSLYAIADMSPGRRHATRRLCHEKPALATPVLRQRIDFGARSACHVVNATSPRAIFIYVMPRLHSRHGSRAPRKHVARRRTRIVFMSS